MFLRLSRVLEAVGLLEKARLGLRSSAGVRGRWLR